MTFDPGPDFDFDWLPQHRQQLPTRTRVRYAALLCVVSYDFTNNEPQEADNEQRIEHDFHFEGVNQPLAWIRVRPRSKGFDVDVIEAVKQDVTIGPNGRSKDGCRPRSMSRNRHVKTGKISRSHVPDSPRPSTDHLAKRRSDKNDETRP